MRGCATSGVAGAGISARGCRAASTRSGVRTSGDMRWRARGGARAAARRDARLTWRRAGSGGPRAPPCRWRSCVRATRRAPPRASRRRTPATTRIRRTTRTTRTRPMRRTPPPLARCTARSDNLRPSTALLTRRFCSITYINTCCFVLSKKF